MSPGLAVVLTGPTACGKSSVALALAPLLDAEIVAADSMQVYKGLDIATAKPTPAERAAVPHHALNLVDPSAPFSVAAWLQHVLPLAAQLRAHNRTPLFVGGTGLYIRSLLHGLIDRPPTDPALLRAWSERSLDALIHELQHIDPHAAATVDLRNRRRVERALAVARAPAPRGPTLGPLPPPWRAFALRRTPSDLRRRIERRVDAMFEMGLAHEFDTVAPHPDSTAFQALGYKEVARWRSGALSESDCRAHLKLSTWHFARRQMTWFRKQPELIWLDLAPDDTAHAVAIRIRAALTEPLAPQPDGPSLTS